MIKLLREIPKHKHNDIQALCDSCMAYEEAMNTGKICWFISDRFYQRFKNKLFIVDETKDDGIRGVAILQFEKSKMVCLSHLYVKRKFRNQGVATKILKEAIAFAKKNNKQLFLNVNPLNKNAMSLYEKMGFAPNAEQSIRMTYSSIKMKK